MPQMSPMWWFSLQMMFSMSFIITMMMLYFDTNKKTYMKKIKYFNKMKWMW
uniref:ATP synthase F0 subunit 8 n=1 Tax=Pedionis sagittata TaxID=1754001 RepID=UPI002410F7F5|nr:ATP synthase F0 subunit 8 [Pedionis sagittata]WEP24761.1 ATP synthase F0 subunit 8 [Pedionis sagittata]